MNDRHIRSFAMACMLLTSGLAQAEYCLDWSAVVRKHSGSSGHCWAKESECNAYRVSRPMGDYSGGCYFKPGLYPRTGQEKGKAKPAEDKAAAEFQKKQQAAKQQQAAQEKMRLDADRNQLLGTLKGVGPVTPERTIVLKPLPPAAGTARSQLDCVNNNASLPLEQTPGSWATRAKDCSAVTPAVPEASAPVPVDVTSRDQTGDLAQVLDQLMQKIAASRALLAKQDGEVEQASREVEREQAKSGKAAGESDALKRAKAALAKAKADREKTAAELAALEKQEASAIDKAAKPPQ